MEPSTGLVIYEDEFCVACPVCHELLERRKRKKQMVADVKKAQKEKAKAEAAAARKEAAPAKASKAKPAAASSWNDIASQENNGQKAAGKKPQVKAAGGAALPTQKKAMASTSAPKVTVASVVVDEPPTPEPAAAPTPPPNPRFEAAEKAISALFSKQRSEELPLEMVRGAVELSNEELDELLQQMDDANKVMCRQGSVYII